MKTEQLTLRDQCIRVLALWEEYREKRREKIKESPDRKGWFELMDWRFGLMVLGCMLLAAEIPLIYPCSRYILSSPGPKATVVGIILLAWCATGMFLIGAPDFPTVWKSFVQWGDDLFKAAGSSYDLDKPFVEALARDAALQLSIIGRRLKGQIEFREKLSAFLAIIFGGASLSGLGQIAGALTKGPSLWLFVPATGLGMTTIVLQTLFIAARVKGDLLVCLEEAEELRRSLGAGDSHPIADKPQIYADGGRH